METIRPSCRAPLAANCDTNIGAYTPVCPVGSVHLRLLDLDGVPTARAVEPLDLVHAGRRVRRSTVRAPALGADARRSEDPACRAFPDFRVERPLIRRAGIKMRDRLLKLRQHVVHRADVLRRQKAVHPVAQAYADPAVPQPADLDA
jgi:hypothetical protein